MTLNQIISSLISSEYDILITLRQAKVLAIGLKNKDFIAWVNAELDGYQKGVELPDYRKFHVSVQATISNGVYTHQNQQMSVLSLPDMIQKKLTYREFSDNIGDLFELSRSNREYITFGIDPAFYTYLQELISPQGGYQITAVYNYIQIGKFKGIIHQVGNKLLDFLLELREIIDPELDIVKIPEITGIKADRIGNLTQQIFHGPVNINGVNQVGSKGDITINYTQELINKGIHQEDIDELKAIAKNPNNDERQKKKNDWIKKVGTYLPTITIMVDFIDTAMEAFL